LGRAQREAKWCHKYNWEDSSVGRNFASSNINGLKTIALVNTGRAALILG